MAAKWRDPATGITVFILAAGVWLLAGTYAPSAALFPRIVAIVMMLAAAGLVIRGLLAPREGEAVDMGAMYRVGTVIVFTVLYVVGISQLGYLAASAIFIFVTAWLLGVRRPAMLVVSTIVFLTCVSWLFVGLFQVPLPRGLILSFFSGS